MKKGKILSLVMGLVLVSVLTFVGVANAQGFRAGDNTGVAAGETVNSMLFAGGNNVNIAGTVNGDVYCGGQTINISGTVNGDVICAGQNVTISGKVAGDVRVAGQTINLNGTTTGSVSVAGQNVFVGSAAVIQRDLVGAGQAVTIDGSVSRDVAVGTQNLTVNGSIGRDINGDVESLDIGTTGKVSGDVAYTSHNELSIANGGAVSGKVTRTEPKANDNRMRPEAMAAFAFGAGLYVFVAAIVFALALALMFPKILEDSTVATMKAPGTTAVVGLVAMFVVPFVITLLFLTAVGAPLALAFMAAWFVITLSSLSFSAYMLGKWMVPKSVNSVVVMLAGMTVTALALLVPILNILVFIVFGIFGTGAILVQGKKLFARPVLKKAK